MSSINSASMALNNSYSIKNSVNRAAQKQHSPVAFSGRGEGPTKREILLGMGLLALATANIAGPGANAVLNNKPKNIQVQDINGDGQADLAFDVVNLHGLEILKPLAFKETSTVAIDGNHIGRNESQKFVRLEDKANISLVDCNNDGYNDFIILAGDKNYTVDGKTLQKEITDMIDDQIVAVGSDKKFDVSE